MNDQPQYYTPLMKEITYGYAMERLALPGTDEWASVDWPFRWEGDRLRVADYDDLERDIEKGLYRVPYLTEEAIAAEGWACKAPSFNNTITAIFNDVDRRVYKMVYTPHAEGNLGRVDCQMTIWWVIATDNGGNQTLYKGPCKSVNCLRRIMRELNIQKP